MAIVTVNNSTSRDFDVPVHGTLYVPALGYSVAYEHTPRQLMRLGMACRGWTDNEIAEYMQSVQPDSKTTA